jgi:hypothetical protein
MITLAIIGLVIFGLIGGALMCDAMMADGCLETVVGFAFGALMFVGVYVGIASMMAIIIMRNM